MAMMSRILLAAVLFGGAPALASAAEFVEFYKNGMAAVESQQWSVAAEMMQKAIDQQPSAKTKVKKALYFRRYLPHFYLGKALFETGDCTGALAAWQESEAQGVVRKFPEYQQIQGGRVACVHMVELQAALGDALRIVESAESAASQARRRLSEVPSTHESLQVLLSRQAEAEASLARVQQRLASRNIVLSAVEEAATLAKLTRSEFEIVSQQADELRVEQVEVRQEELTARIQRQVVAARRQLRASQYLQPYPASVARRRAAVEQALEHARAATDGSLSGGELQVIESELTKATRDLRRAILPPPAQLTDAAAAYLGRDYAGVLAILGESQFPDIRASSHSHLLQAAALFALYYSTGAGDGDLLEQARQQVLACRNADPERSPPTAVFSPSFVGFFENQTLETAESSPDEGVDEGL